MLTAAVTKPASSSDSKTVSARRERCSSFMLKTASRIARAVPAARTAPNEEPYSTKRRSPRWNQTRCGMPCTSGCAPVASDARHTGVSEGNVVTDRRYLPFSIRKARAGTAPRSTASSSIPGVRPSMTMRTSFGAGTWSVPGEGAQTRVALRAPAAQPHPESRDERERRNEQGPDADEDSRPDPRSSARKGAPDELDRPCGADQPADPAARGLLGVAEDYAEHDPGSGSDERRDRHATSPSKRACGQHAQGDPKPCEDADPVPAAHRAPV